MSKIKINRPRGTADVLPGEAARWRELERLVTDLAVNHGFGELRMPTFEHTELFNRGVGDTTDIVTKEMYTFEDKGGRSVTLRPEGTASAVRACIENGLFAGVMPLKLFYIAPMFRYEKPQSGRLREHHQFGVECFGAAGADGDLEVISLANAYIKAVLSSDRLGAVELNVNTIGCADCRAAYRAELLKYLEDKPMCKLCAERVGRNPLRVLDCKDENCRDIVKNAPVMTVMMCADCAAHYKEVLTGLERLGIRYKQNDRLVRGLDYYNGMVFEYIYNGLTVVGGGRYDTLVELLGGNPAAACGFGSGIERMLAVREELGIRSDERVDGLIYVAVADTQDSPAAVTARALTAALRLTGEAERDITGRSLKAQLKHADKLNARFLIVIGADEVETGQVVIKDMTSGEKFDCALNSKEITETCASIRSGEHV